MLLEGIDCYNCYVVCLGYVELLVECIDWCVFVLCFVVVFGGELSE